MAASSSSVSSLRPPAPSFTPDDRVTGSGSSGASFISSTSSSSAQGSGSSSSGYIASTVAAGNFSPPRPTVSSASTQKSFYDLVIEKMGTLSCKPTRITVEPDRDWRQRLMGYFVVKFHFDTIARRDQFAIEIQRCVSEGKAPKGIPSDTPGEIAVVASAYYGGLLYFRSLGLEDSYERMVLEAYQKRPKGTDVLRANELVTMHVKPSGGLWKLMGR
jgi:hypothetical protein